MSFNSALSGMKTANDQLQVLSNNIANSSTIGFKKSRAEFSDVYAAGSLGSSANVIGTGVKLSAVTQQFTQGIIDSADTNLDLAVNGNGFFVLDNAGSKVYTRAGAFKVDKDGNISNSRSEILIGFLTDNLGNITGAQGPLKIQNTSLNPQKTNNVTVQLNLDSSDIPPSADFVRGFTPTSPPKSNTFNNSASTQIYDTLGNEHILTTYYVKAPAERTWHVYVGIDGTDVTPLPATPPAGSPSSPGSYTTGQLAAPFTIVFDQGGAYVPNNTAAPAQYYGTVPVTSTTSALTTAGTLATLNVGDLSINGIPINISVVNDTVSTTDNKASSITIVNAINQQTSKHKVVAQTLPNVLDFTAGTFTSNALSTGDFVINGINIVGAPAAATVGALVTLINNVNGTGIPGVLASDNAGQLRLTANDGRNIQVKSSGATTSGISFGNFNLTTAQDQVLRGSYTMTIGNDQGIVVGGITPTKAALTAGPLAGIVQTNSDGLQVSFLPGTGATSPQDISISLSSSTQFASPFAITALTQDGYTTGRLISVDVDPTGIITARFGNGQSQQLGQVALANFRNPQGLQPLGDTSWAETFGSGVALLGAPGTSDLGLIQSGSLESSNVELTDELVGLIVAQRDFQANAQTIRTEDAITQSLINIK